MVWKSSTYVQSLQTEQELAAETDAEAKLVASVK